jgi:hypothetical protein
MLRGVVWQIVTDVSEEQRDRLGGLSVDRKVVLIYLQATGRRLLLVDS